jgi:hypothetical protein
MMDKPELERRDRVLRAYFEGRDWDKNNEYALKRRLVLNSQSLLLGYPLLFDDEWEVEPNRNQKGRGDLLFTDGEGRYAVVEVKWLDVNNTGKTTRNNRTKKRQKVRDQAANYVDALAQCLETFTQIEGYRLTNEDDEPQLVRKLPG